MEISGSGASSSEAFCVGLRPLLDPSSQTVGVGSAKDEARS